MKIWIFTFVFGMFDLASIDEDDVIEKIQKSNLFEWETKSPVGSIYPSHLPCKRWKSKKSFPYCHKRQTQIQRKKEKEEKIIH